MGNEKLALTVPDNKQDAFSRILRYMTKTDITLSSQEETILDRWVYCDTLLRDGTLSHDEIIEDLKAKWHISRFTASKDINATQQLFARSRQVSKKYLAHIHEEKVKQDLNRVRKQLFYKKNKETGAVEERELNDKEITALAKLNDAYTKAILALPDEQVTDAMPPPVFNFLLAPGQKIEVGMNFDQAAKIADESIMEENEDGEFEVINNQDEQ